MRATAVIGANYGDEGKGLITNWLASPDTVVVRFNGGAQAGHTVVSSKGRHIFSHFGAGTLSGSDTYLAKHFVLNPILFYQEANRLRSLTKFFPQVVADPRCYVTTPYDMLINQAVEDSRALARHGSCGIGFGETIERNKYPMFRLLRSDLQDKDKVQSKLKLIRDHWIPARLREFNINPFPKDDPKMDNRMLFYIANAFNLFNKQVGMAGAEFLLRKNIIFEGAQGLALDMDGPDFPHVTRSNTGLTNIAPLVKVLKLQLDVIYVTRTYLTRHGAGPLLNECDMDIEDATNVEHPYQGTMRFAPLDIPGMEARIKKDNAIIPQASSSIAVTCLDQLPNAEEICEQIPNVEIVSRGPSSKDVEDLFEKRKVK